MRRGNGYEQTFQKITTGTGPLGQTHKTSMGRSNSQQRVKRSSNSSSDKSRQKEDEYYMESSGTEKEQNNDVQASSGIQQASRSGHSSISDRQLYWNRLAQKQKQ